MPGPLLRDPGPLRAGLYDESYAKMRAAADDVAALEYNTALLNTTREPLPDPVVPEPMLAKTTLPGIERHPVEGKPVFGSDEDFAKAQAEASTLADTTPLGQFTSYRPGFEPDKALKGTPVSRKPAVLSDWEVAFPGSKQAAPPEPEPEILSAPMAVPASNSPALLSNDRSPFNRALAHIIHREGVRTKVYADSLGNPTVGVGHLVKPGEKLKVGDSISSAQVKQMLDSDGRVAFEAARKQMADAGIRDNDLLIALTSVNFQLGSNWTKDFDNSWALIKAGRYGEAADRLEESDWNAQTPERVKDFQKALRQLERTANR